MSRHLPLPTFIPLAFPFSRPVVFFQNLLYLSLVLNSGLPLLFTI